MGEKNLKKSLKIPKFCRTVADGASARECGEIYCVCASSANAGNAAALAATFLGLEFQSWKWKTLPPFNGKARFSISELSPSN
jgi:hypothetical protein